jgi:hypothetical protein
MTRLFRSDIIKGESLFTVNIYTEYHQECLHIKDIQKTVIVKSNSVCDC